jgi:hypothetical protein
LFPKYEEATVADLFLERDAVLSDCGTYRYLLRRTWDHTLPRALFVMLNPSTADAEIDDATIRSCIRLSKCLGYGSFEVVNLFAFRSTDPDALDVKDIAKMVGERNAAIVDAALCRCDMVICAWGAHPSSGARRNEMLSTIRALKPAAYCFGKTKAGYPKHPLYIKSGTALEVFA